jgi:hypothetical protein
VLTGHEIGRGRNADEPAASSGERTDGVRGPGRCSGLPSLGSSPIDAPGCCEGGTGSRRAESRRRRGIARIRAHLRRRCRLKFGRMQRLGSGKVGLGGFQTPRWCSGVICDGYGALAR